MVNAAGKRHSHERVAMDGKKWRAFVVLAAFLVTLYLLFGDQL